MKFTLTWLRSLHYAKFSEVYLQKNSLTAINIYTYIVILVQIYTITFFKISVEINNVKIYKLYEKKLRKKLQH